MNHRAKTRRRWFGTICITTAIVMLIVGETVLTLTGVPLLIYWMTCFILTGFAAGAAIVDAARVRTELKEEQRSLLQATLEEIEREKQSRHKPKP